MTKARGVELRMAQEDRFVLIYQQFPKGISMTPTPAVRILVDTMTGIQYMYSSIGNSGGPTVLLGQDGKPLLYQPPNKNI